MNREELKAYCPQIIALSKRYHAPIVPTEKGKF